MIRVSKNSQKAMKIEELKNNEPSISESQHIIDPKKSFNMEEELLSNEESFRSEKVMSSKK